MVQWSIYLCLVVSAHMNASVCVCVCVCVCLEGHIDQEVGWPAVWNTETGEC